MKKKSINKIIIFILIIFITFILNGCKKDKQTLGVWWWDDELDEEYLDFAIKNNVTEIYYCSSKFNQETEKFIKKANRNDIDVYWLAGEYQWIYDYQKLKKLLERYLQYQEEYKNIFKGIHFDIEPHQDPQFDMNRNEIITEFVNLCFQISCDYSNIYIEYDLPFWLDDNINFNGESKEAYKFIMDYSSRVTIMSYRDTYQEIYKISEDEIEYAKTIGKKINLGVETKSSEGDSVSFMEEGKEVMNREIIKLRKLIPSNCGVVIHHIKDWFDLKS